MAMLIDRSTPGSGQSSVEPGDDTRRERRDIRILFAIQIAALAVHVAGVCVARANGHRGTAETLAQAGLWIAFASAVWVLTEPRLTRAMRNAAVLSLGLTPTLMWRNTNPLMFTGFDEQLHVRTLRDIMSSHHLFEANPLLEVSPRYPGIEMITVLIHQTGVPMMVSAVLVILICRILLVTALCTAVEQLTGDVRAAGLAVAVYAFSPQFFFFNSQYAYQTMALPLALAAVALIDRARKAEHPLPFFGGATACLFAVAMTHHMTSFLTMLFFVLWTAFQRGPARIRVAYAAMASLAAVLAWAIVQRSLLEGYFGPIIGDVGGQVKGGQRRSTFKDTAGASTPQLDKLLLLYFAGALALLVAILGVVTLVRWKRGERYLLRWSPHLLVLLLTATIPVSLAGRVIPKGGELFDRASSFLFLALGLVVAGYWARLRLRMVLRVTLIVLAAGMCLGGYVMGSGPSWARLPGTYLVAADPRSMDAEVLAGVAWARDNIEPGSRIVGDRVSSDLLAAAGLWPVMKVGQVDAPVLYTNERWRRPESDMAAVLKVRYLFVDRRLATELPHFGSYFFNGMPGKDFQITDSQLAKFDNVPGITEVYRHGPISIYDLKGLGVPEMKNGWYQPAPKVSVAHQVGVGLALGLLLAGLMRGRFWPTIAARATRLRRRWGPALTGAVVFALLTLLSATLLLTHIWMTPVTYGTIALVNLRAIVAGLRRAVAAVSWRRFAAVSWRRFAAVSWRRFAAAGMLAAGFGAVVGVAAYSAATANIFQVHEILSDPAAVHRTPAESGG